ncbi:helix-turn-helix domain-containing protein [Aminobacter sp. SR38]|jgi:hypothetical protein|uniref:helix-turn-helix domain-containing protein n=1 Tax=Aminobacter sp. SR38 TaxID=2774562 RepID=UPI001782C51F|nr:helix-turn-helix domain-containing protein [Aminobacter sp. SR38]QOF71708.1 helix-turn-helix domain-containing protein [Aminobacter sp. SR38]
MEFSLSTCGICYAASLKNRAPLGAIVQLEELYTTVEAAALLRASVQTLARWRGDGTGPAYVKRAGRILYRESDIAQYLAKATRTKTRGAAEAP